MTLDLAAIQQGMAKVSTIDCQIELFTTLDSTNKYLVRQLTSQPTLALPRLCVAQHQTSGVGRRGRAWYSPSDSITLSLAQRVAKPASALMGLSLVTGVILAELVKKLVGDKQRQDIGVKWPNDLLLGDRKLGGILIEVPQSAGSSSTVITGIGINVSQGEALSRVDQPYAVLESLSNESYDQADLIGQIAGTVLEAYSLFGTMGWVAFAERWAAVDYLKGKAVTITSATPGDNGSDPGRGRAVGVAEDGGLIVEHASERTRERKTYYSGEISVRAESD